MSDQGAMRLLLQATIDRGELFEPAHERWWMGVRYVDRPYGRGPVAGESIRLGDKPDPLPWPVDHVAWNNSGLPDLALSFEDDDATFDDIGVVQVLEGYGFRRLLVAPG